MTAAAIKFQFLISPNWHSVSFASARSLSKTSPPIFHRPSTFTIRSPNLQNIVASSVSTKYIDRTSETSFLEPKKPGLMYFVKYQGLGNDFILVDNRESSVLEFTSEQAMKLCNRNFGIGADGVIFVLPGVDGSNYAMKIFNSDGSMAEMCGNGIRCFAKFVAEFDKPHGRKRFTVHTGAGVIIPEILDDGRVKVDMGNPILKASLVPTKLPPNKDQSVIQALIDVDETQWNVTCLSMGNPHCVTFSSKEIPDLVVDELNLLEIGPKFEHHPMFPARTNTEFVQVISRSHLKMRVWERGAGETLACGTGACAVLIAAVLEGRTERSCSVDLRGGTLEIEWREDNNRVYMTGPAEAVFYGSFPL